MLRLKKFAFVMVCFSGVVLACTSFGAITSSGSVIGKNRDFLYSEQKFEEMEPLKQFEQWYGNRYNHNNEFYALIANSDVKFGVNKYGLTAIEEDPSFPVSNTPQRKYMQPYVGYSEGMILYGVLQNFVSVDEIVPYIKDIFSTAAPNFYQIADAHNILTVEVAYGSTNNDPTRRYTYKIITKNGDFFTHTNTYLSSQLNQLNSLSTNKDGINGSNNRLNKISQYVKSADGDFSNAFNWYLDTTSNVGSSKDKNYCFNTSIFRSDLQNLSTIESDTSSNKVYGTVSSFMVEHKNDNTVVHIRILDQINTLRNGNQKITYKELNIPLDKLFSGKSLTYTTNGFTRLAPLNGVCE